MDKMRSMILYDHRNNSTAAERKEYYENELKTRAVGRGGRDGHEFHVRVLAYPERSLLEMDPIPVSEKNHLLSPQTGVGIRHNSSTHWLFSICKNSTKAI